MCGAPCPQPYVHLVNPTPTPAGEIFNAVASVLDLRSVPYAEWLAALESSQAREEENPAMKLMEFFRSSSADSPDNLYLEVFGLPRLDTRLARQSAKTTLTGVRLGGEHVKRWIGYWRTVRFLN
jgi:hypothetical protein